MEYNELIAEIARKSELTEEQVRKQIQLLVKQIEETAQAGKALEIRGMGMFYLSSKGELVFDASDELAMEVNYRYAGMEPVLVTPGSVRRQEAPSSPPGGDEIEETLSGMFGEENVEKDEETARSKEVSKASGPDTESEKKEDVPDTPSEKGKPAVGSAKKQVSKAKRTKLKPREKRRGWFRREKKERDPIRHLIKTLIAIVILGILFHYTLEELKDRGIITDEPLIKNEVKPLPNPPVIEQGPWYGMYGTVESFEQYHTIALHAVQNRNRADEWVGNLRSEGYRGVLSSVDHPEHGTLWRISIGQFESEADARRSALFLPEELRQNIFVTQIVTP